MRKGILGGVTILLASASLNLAAVAGEGERVSSGLPPLLQPVQVPTPSPDAGPAQPEILNQPRTAAPEPEPAKPATASPGTAPTDAAGPTDHGFVHDPFSWNFPHWELGTRLYTSAEYLYWWNKNPHVPPLATAGSLADAVPAAVGQPHTVVLFGGAIDEQPRSGARFLAGYWLDPNGHVSLEASGFLLERQTIRFHASSDGSTVLGVPTFDNGSLTESAVLLAQPIQNGSPGASGSTTATLSSRFWGAEGNFRLDVGGNRNWRVDLLTGFRYLELKESLVLNRSTQTVPAGTITNIPQPGSTPAFPGLPFDSYSTMESYNTHNSFYGAQTGVQAVWHCGQWTVDLLAKLALGDVHQVALLNGQTVVTAGPATTTVPMGIYVQPSQLGRHSREEFGVVPEVGLKLGYQLGEHVGLFFSYSIIYMRSDVVRVGDVLDRSAATETLALPFTFKDTDYWTQGISGGVQIRF